MSLKKMKKAELQDLAEGLGLNSEGTKVVLEEEINSYFDSHPDLADESKYTKYFAFRQKSRASATSTPTKSFRASESDISDASGSEDERVYEVSDEDEDASGDLDAVADEAKATALGQVQHFFDEKIGKLKSCSAEMSDKLVDFTIEKNDDLKAVLSNPISIYNLEILTEFVYVASPYVKFNPLQNFISESVNAKLPELISKLPIMDVGFFFDLKNIYVMCLWFTMSILLPSISSYYVNFSKLNNKYDPFAFFLTKGLLNYFFLGRAVNFDDIANDVAVSASKVSGVSPSCYAASKDVIFHSSISLRKALGLVPFFGTTTAVLVAFYAAISA